MTLAEIRQEAATLCDKEKGLLASELLTMISSDQHWVSDEEVLNRVEELESGAVEEISFDELKRRLGK